MAPNLPRFWRGLGLALVVSIAFYLGIFLLWVLAVVVTR